MTEYVVTLTPDERATERVNRLKTRVRRLVGPQQYLEDDPHVTLYVGDLSVHPEAFELPPLDRPTFDVTGWEVFENDIVTSNHTIVCRIDAPGLHDYQKRVAGALESHRNRRMIDRYERAYDDFDERRRENLTAYGFPFIGSGWKPHLTIASIDPIEFDAVWNDLKAKAPVGEYEFESVTVYELAGSDLRSAKHLPL